MPPEFRLLEGFGLGIAFCVAWRGLSLALRSSRRMEGLNGLFLATFFFALALAYEMRSLAIFAVSTLLLAGSWWALLRTRRDGADGQAASPG
jgi:hypothetical protein